jgi:hypothetical protein
VELEHTHDLALDRQVGSQSHKGHPDQAHGSTLPLLCNIPSEDQVSVSWWPVKRLHGDSRVGLGCREEHYRSRRCPTSGAHGQCSGSGGDVVGEIGNDEDIGAAEGKVEGFHLPAETFDQLLRCRRTS